MTSILYDKHRLQERLTRKTTADEREAMRYSKLTEWERTKRRMLDTLDDFRRKLRLLQSQHQPKNGAETEHMIKAVAVSIDIDMDG